MLNEQQRKRIEERLLEERDRALEALREFDRGREESLQDATGELTMYRFHMADVGSETMEQEKQFLLASNEGRQLNSIDEALRRLYQNPEEFGRCERCGRPIAFERLKIVPSTTLCTDCQRLGEADGEV